MAEDDTTASETYELYGPTNYSLAQIAELVDKEIYKKRRHINLPKRPLKFAANLLNKYIYWHTTSPDEIEREFIDQKIDPNAKTFKDLGIEPGELANFTFHYLVCQGYVDHWIVLIDFTCSKGIAAVPSTICHQLRSARKERTKSIYMSLMISKDVRAFRSSDY